MLAGALCRSGIDQSGIVLQQFNIKHNPPILSHNGTVFPSAIAAGGPAGGGRLSGPEHRRRRRNDPSHGNHHQARAVHDVSLLELLRVIQTLQSGRDMSGVELDGTPDFFVGSTTHAGAKGRSAEIEVEEMAQRAQAGVRFFITPPLFDLELIRPVLRRVDRERTIILPTVLLLKSLGMARYIERNMPHMAIPPEIIDRVQKAGDKVRECVRIAVELVAGIKAEGFKGVVLSTLGWERKLADIVEGI